VSGHIIIEDIPGLGKTTLALILAKSLHLSFGRIQGTNDYCHLISLVIICMISTTGVYDLLKGLYSITLCFLMKLIRASPKTQSALLEAMEENCVTLEGVTYSLPIPFLL